MKQTEKRPGRLKLFLKYMGEVKDYWPALVLVFSLKILLTWLDIITPLFTKILFDYAYPLRSMTLLNWAIGGMVCIYLVVFLVKTLRDYFDFALSENFINRLRRKLFYHIERLPLKIIQRKSKDALISTLTTATEKMKTLVLTTQEVLIILFRLFITVWIVFSVNPTIAFMILLGVPFYLIDIQKFERRIGYFFAQNAKLMAQCKDFIHQRLQKIFLVKAFRQEESESERLAQLSDHQSRVLVKASFLSSLHISTQSSLLDLWMFFMTWFMGYQVISGHLTIGEIMTLALYLGQIKGPLQKLKSQLLSIKLSLISMGSIDAVLSEPTEETELGGKDELNIQQGQVTIEDVSYAHLENVPGLAHLTLEIPSRSMIAIVGHSGSGKSTLINLLMRYFPYENGAIYIDGQKISSVNLLSLRSRIGLVSQDYSLFNGTIRDNIAYGKPEATQDEIEKAAQDACALDFIRALPNGFDTVLATGEELSSGQKQMIAIARALIMNPPIIMFDEATAALDPLSEFSVQQAITHLAKIKTVIVITHRLATIRNADKIAVLNGGTIVEIGAFEELMNKRGFFYRFYIRQFGGFAEFKKNLDIEHERCVRYGSSYCVAAFQLTDYQTLKSQHGDFFASELMEEIKIKWSFALRRGDVICNYGDGRLFILVPELTGPKCFGFTDRMSSIFKNQAIMHQNISVPLVFEGVLIDVSKEKSRVQSIERLIEILLEDLDKNAGSGRFAVVKRLNSDEMLETIPYTDWRAPQ